MKRFLKQFQATYVAICVVASGLLWSVHIHGAAGCTACHAHSNASHCHQNSEELPLLPPHESEDCAICHFSGDLGEPLPQDFDVREGNLAEALVQRTVSFNLILTVSAYHGRAPPKTDSL